MEKFPSTNRRNFLVALAFPDTVDIFNKLLPKSNSYDQWFHAVRMDYVKICKKLLEFGFDPNTIEPKKYDSALIIAVREKSNKVFDLLLQNSKTNINSQSKNGDTALMVAAFLSYTELALKLIVSGAQVNMPYWSPLHYAASVGNLEIIKKLINYNAFVDANSPNRTTPLMMAARGGHLEVVLYLINVGANIKLENELGFTAIDFSKNFGYDQITKILFHELKK